MTRGKRFKRLVRARAAETGQSYSAALRRFQPKPQEANPMTSQTTSDTPTCSFCGKPREEVTKLIAGPSAYICDECIRLSYDIVNGQQPGAGTGLPTPPFAAFNDQARAALSRRNKRPANSGTTTSPPSISSSARSRSLTENWQRCSPPTASPQHRSGPWSPRWLARRTKRSERRLRSRRGRCDRSNSRTPRRTTSAMSRWTSRTSSSECSPKATASPRSFSRPPESRRALSKRSPQCEPATLAR